MATMSYDDDLGRIQRTLAQCHDMAVRRTAVIEALNLRSGLSVLEVGCGGGFYVVESARSVGASGEVCAIDLSPDQIEAAKARCVDFPWAEFTVGSVTDMPYDDNAFDVAYAVQVIEYVPDLDAALAEIRRALRPGGRVVILATNWDSVVWRSNDRDRMNQILKAWDAHAPFPNLPAMLTARLRRAGFEPTGQQATPIINLSFNENSFSYWLAKLMARFLTGKGLVDPDVVNAWLAEFDERERQGAYAFYSTPIITTAMKTP